MEKGSKEHQECEEFEKCGEIFHDNGCFKIICTDCDEQNFDFKEFLNHFKKKHCTQKENFIGNEHRNYSSSPKKNACNFESFEAITLLSPGSTNNTNGLSTDEEKDVLQTNGVFETDTTTNNDDGADINKLTLHLRKKYPCGNCDKKFASTKSLKIHIKRRHCEKVQYTCSQCTETFTEKRFLRKHQRDSHVSFTCKICKKEFKRQRGLKDHMATHDGTRNFSCDYEGCTKTFKVKRGLDEHKNTHITKQSYVCEICGYCTVRKHTLVAHVRAHTGEKPYPCKICGKCFISASMVKEHSASHATERRHVCDVCGANFARPKSLYHHKPLHLGIKKFVCSVCGKAYAQASGLSKHMRTHKVNGKIVLGLE